MPDAGFLGGGSAERQPNPVEVAPTPEVDQYEQEERAAEQQMEQQEHKEEFLEEAPTSALPATATAEPEAPAAAGKDEITIEVEKILEAGLGDYVPDMPEEARQKFLKKGGEVAAQLSVMVRTLNIQVSLVLKLLKEWLLTIPGVNKYFIEQEAKIKADRIIELANQHRS
ncbi:MAG TPA: hypothetical protein VMU11_01035 [Verrucomicrobiae bacterium]|nr:hypothetical protein [Verrucomicrobiae bacterium]